MPTIYIDKEPYTIEDEGKNLLEVALSLGFNLPYFCWHPAMHSVGACRQCAVKMFRDENDTRGRIVMACMTPAADGTRISVDDPEAIAFRAGVIEWLMVNHPHDCPVCDEGGECHLQDMTVMTGHVYRRARFENRSYRNQDLGPFVNHEMNRCIQCYRCVRFYNDYAGGNDFGVFSWHDDVYFGRSADGVLESEFSGNLVEICPTGVFTDKTLRCHYTRKWDLQTAPSVCVHCGLGCNTIPGERYGTLRRVRNRYNGQVNGYFLCDRGRYGYEFVNSDHRIKAPLLREGESRREITREAALERMAELLETGKVIGIGSPRASLESNFALRSLVGPENFYAGISLNEHHLLREVLRMLREGPARGAAQADAARADAVFILGEDVNNYAPMLALQLRQAAMRAPREKTVAELRLAPFDDYPIRQAIQQERGPFFIATPLPTRLESEATATYRAAPDDLARLGFAVAHALDPDAPAVEGLPDEERELAERIAGELKATQRPLVVAGCGGGSLAAVQAAANVAWALRKAGVEAQLAFTVPACNSLGLALLDGGEIAKALEALRSGEAETVIVLENDLYRELDGGTADAVFAHARQVIALDSLENAVTARADLVLPSATFAEADGTLVNNEGRAQRFFQVFVPEGEIRASWRWLGELAEPRWETLDDIIDALVAGLPELAGVREAAPAAEFRILGQKVARQPHRYTGRTAINAGITVQEPPPPPDPDAPLSFSMEGYQGKPPPPLIPRFWAPGWNSVQSVHKFQEEAGGPLRGGDPGVRLLEPAGEAAIPYYTSVPAAFAPRDDALLIVPAYHIFGSEELSRHAPGIAQLAPAPYLALAPADAERLGVEDGQAVTVTIDGQSRELPARLTPELPAGVAAAPAGLPEIRGLRLSAWADVRPAGGEEAAL
jgi:NADH-quinone oxidoreductase subunit G